ncbi:MAG: hypothetical protein ACNA7W_01205 [Pseudomonadales bacterium]
MSDVVPIKDAARRKAARQKQARKLTASGKTLCQRGFHKWRVDQTKQFDVRQGRLVTIRECERCGTRRTTLD